MLLCATICGMLLSEKTTIYVHCAYKQTQDVKQINRQFVRIKLKEKQRRTKDENKKINENNCVLKIVDR